MKLVIDRQTWLRGEGTSTSYLFRDKDSKMCCLGFLGRACGATQEQLNYVSTPSGLQLYGKPINWPTGLVNKDQVANTALCERLMHTNDNQTLSEKDREESLIKQFKKLGIEVEFIN